MTRRDERGRSRSGEKEEPGAASVVAKERSRSRRRRREEEKKPNRRRRDSSGGSSSGSRRRRKDKERDKRKKRDGHRERDRERDREREKDKERERQKDREREKEREREKDKRREKDKEPGKEKEQENQKEAEKEKEKQQDKDKKRHSRSRSSSGSSSSGPSKSRKVARLSGRFDQKELGREDAAMQQALMVQAEQTKVHAVAPPVPVMMGMPPPQTNPQVEEFLMHNPVEPHAAARLRALPFEYQQMVLARGSLMGARDPTAVVLGRIRGATQGTLQYSRDVMMWSPAMVQQMQSQGMSVPGMTGVAQQPGGQPTPLQTIQEQQRAAQPVVSKPDPPSPVAAPAPEPEDSFGGDPFEKEKSRGRASREDPDKEESAKKSAKEDKLPDEGSKKSGWFMFDWRRSRPQVGEEAVEEGAAEAEKTEEGQIEVRLLLMRAGVPEYLPKFIEAGFCSMKAVREMQEADMLEKCGMTEEHAKLLQQDLAQGDRSAADGHETAAPRMTQGLPDIPPKQREHFEKARPPVVPITLRGDASGQEGLARDAPGQEAASMLPKFARPPLPKEPGAASAHVAHLQAAAAAAEAEAAAQARRAAEVEVALRQNKESGSAAPAEKPMLKLPKFVPYKGPPVEPQPQLDVHLDPPEPQDASQFPFPGAGAPPMNWGPTVSQSPGLKLRPLIPGGMLNKDPPEGEEGAGSAPEVRSPAGGAPSDAASAGADASGQRQAAPPKFSVADMLSMSGLKPTAGGPQKPEAREKAAMDGQAPPLIEALEPIVDASLLPLGLPPLDPNLMLDPGMMPPPLAMPPLPGMPPLPPLGPGMPPGVPGMDPPGMDPGLPGLPGLPPLSQFPPAVDPALEQQLQMQQDAATQQAYQFWVQQQLNAQMALFENERSLISSRQSDQREVKPGPKKPSTQARLPGDWNCPGCGDHQFARNRTCRSCGGLRPAETY